MSDDRLLEFVRLASELVERDGQRLFRARNSPAIIGIEIGDHKLTIKRVRQRLMISFAYTPDRARSCIYDDGPSGDDVVCATTWLDTYQPFLDELRRRLVLDAIAFGAKRNT